MTEAETRDLLAFIAGYDGTVPAEEALAAWQDSLASPWVPNLSLDEALGAVAEHYRSTPVRVQPSDVLRLVRDDRAASATQGGPHFGVPSYGVPPNEEYRAARAELERRNAARKAQR